MTKTFAVVSKAGAPPAKYLFAVGHAVSRRLPVV
jgi:hypothetical protein